MILKNDFSIINTSIEKEVQNAIEIAKSKSTNEFLLLVSNAQYIEKLKNCGVNPHVINYRTDINNDLNRLEFLIDYLNENYSFKTGNTVDSNKSITFELMIYTHLWESKPYLKQLFRLANLINSIDYPWYVEVPDFPKHPFI